MTNTTNTLSLPSAVQEFPPELYGLVVQLEETAGECRRRSNASKPFLMSHGSDIDYRLVGIYKTVQAMLRAQMDLFTIRAHLDDEVKEFRTFCKREVTRHHSFTEEAENNAEKLKQQAARIDIILLTAKKFAPPTFENREKAQIAVERAVTKALMPVNHVIAKTTDILVYPFTRAMEATVHNAKVVCNSDPVVHQACKKASTTVKEAIPLAVKSAFVAAKKSYGDYREGVVLYNEQRLGIPRLVSEQHNKDIDHALLNIIGLTPLSFITRPVTRILKLTIKPIMPLAKGVGGYVSKAAARNPLESIPQVTTQAIKTETLAPLAAAEAPVSITIAKKPYEPVPRATTQITRVERPPSNNKRDYPKRGDVYEIYFPKAERPESTAPGLGVVVSFDRLNQVDKNIAVIPLASIRTKLARLPISEGRAEVKIKLTESDVYNPYLAQYANVSECRMVPKGLLRQKIGFVGPNQMKEVEKAIPTTFHWHTDTSTAVEQSALRPPLNTPQRGEIYWVKDEHAVGVYTAFSDPRTVHPAIVLSHINAEKGRLIIAPITKQVDKCFGTHAIIKIHGALARVMVDKCRVINKKQLGEKFWEADAQAMQRVALAERNLFGLLESPQSEKAVASELLSEGKPIPISQIPYLVKPEVKVVQGESIPSALENPTGLPAFEKPIHVPHLPYLVKPEVKVVQGGSVPSALEKPTGLAAFEKPDKFPHLVKFMSECQVHRISHTGIGASKKGYLHGHLLYQPLENHLLIVALRDTKDFKLRKRLGIKTMANNAYLEHGEALHLFLDSALALAKEKNYERIFFAYRIHQEYPVDTLIAKRSEAILGWGEMSQGINSRPLPVLEVAVPK